MYASSSSLSSSDAICNEFVQPDPRQFPQAGVHSMLCFLQVHHRELPSVRQLHLITRSRLSGAGASAVCRGTNPSSRSVDGRELHLMRPSHGTVDVGGSPGCQSICHCR